MKQAKVKPVSLIAIIAAGAQFPFQVSDLDGDKFTILAKGKDDAFFGTDSKGDSALLNGEEEAYIREKTPLYQIICDQNCTLTTGKQVTVVQHLGGWFVANMDEAVRLGYGTTSGYRNVRLGEQIMAYRD